MLTNVGPVLSQIRNVELKAEDGHRWKQDDTVVCLRWKLQGIMGFTTYMGSEKDLITFLPSLK